MAIVPTGSIALLQVYDMPEALAFYQGGLGFDVVSASPAVDTPEGRFSHWVWLELGSAQVMLNTAYDEGQRPPQRVVEQQRWHRDTCLYFDVPDVDAVHEELQSKLPEIRSPTNAQYGMRQLYLTDPDGYLLCFQTRIS
jgi:glyoxylase I family protein